MDEQRIRKNVLVLLVVIVGAFVLYTALQDGEGQYVVSVEEMRTDEFDPAIDVLYADLTKQQQADFRRALGCGCLVHTDAFTVGGEGRKPISEKRVKYKGEIYSMRVSGFIPDDRKVVE